MRKFYLLIFFSFITYIKISAQNNTSPYSIIGIGDIESSYLDRTTGMANTGVAISSNRFMYNNNPASYASLNDHLFYLELSTRYKGVMYSGGTITANADNSSSGDIQFKKITGAIKLKPRWGLSFGLLPFSNSNYSFYANKIIAGVGTPATAYYTGSGNINQAYIANSFKLTNKLSVGIQTSFIFGQQQQQETIYPGSVIDSTLITTNNTYYTNFYFKGGLQYHTKVNSNWNVSAGATGSLQTKLNAVTGLTVQEGNSTIYDNDNYANSYFRLPLIYSGGLAANFKNKLTFAADYSHQSWGNLNVSGVGYNLTNSSRYSTGFEYSKLVNYRGLIFEKYFLQGGLYYSDSYLSINGKQINDFGLSFGYGKNFSNGLGFQSDLQLGTRGTTSNGLIKENYMQITFTLSFAEYWITKKRYN